MPPPRRCTRGQVPGAPPRPRGCPPGIPTRKDQLPMGGTERSAIFDAETRSHWRVPFLSSTVSTLPCSHARWGRKGHRNCGPRPNTRPGSGRPPIGTRSPPTFLKLRRQREGRTRLRAPGDIPAAKQCPAGQRTRAPPIQGDTTTWGACHSQLAHVAADLAQIRLPGVSCWRRSRSWQRRWRRWRSGGQVPRRLRWYAGGSSGCRP
jgi:hypothetical protein